MLLPATRSFCQSSKSVTVPASFPSVKIFFSPYIALKSVTICRTSVLRNRAENNRKLYILKVSSPILEVAFTLKYIGRLRKRLIQQPCLTFGNNFRDLV